MPALAHTMQNVYSFVQPENESRWALIREMGLSASLIQREKSGNETAIMAAVEGRKARQHSLQKDIAIVISACEACKGLVDGEVDTAS